MRRAVKSKIFILGPNYPTSILIFCTVILW